MTENRGVATRQVGRYTLGDLVEERHGCTIWRGLDSTLNREVAVWLIPQDDELAADLEAATRTAATVDDRRIVRILDFFSDDEQLVAITEWPVGEILADHLSVPLPPQEAARIAYEVAGAIESAHGKGIAHGRLRPSNVRIGDGGEVRVTGLGLDAVLAGIDPVADADPVSADIHGIGSLLYAGLTARWPDGAVEGIAAAPEVGGRIPPPSRLLADVPESLDDLCARTILPIVPPRGRTPVTSAGQARELLGASLTDLTGRRRPITARIKAKDSPIARIALAAAVIALVLGLGWMGLQLLGTDAQPAPPEPPPVASPAAEAEASKAPESVTYRIVGATDFDPLGNGEENRGRVPFSFDGDRNTAWRTVTYYNKSLDKPGVGVLFDLGAPRTISKVRLDLVGNGTDLQVLTSSEAGATPNDYELMAQATEAGERVTLRGPRPTSARYVLVWMTGLPQVDGGWRGGIREIQISS